jgi:hypothetical protein
VCFFDAIITPGIDKGNAPLRGSVNHHGNGMKEQRINRTWGIFRLIFATGLFSVQISVTPSLAFDARAYASLRQLDPAMRLEQVCDMEAMDRIGREDRRFHPDRAKSNVIVPPEHLGDLLKAEGAAFRSNGRWYALSFVCDASPDHLKVTSFNYRIGDLIPNSKWDDYGLWP